MSNVMMPQKKPGLTQQLLPMAGQAAGAAFGGPVGGMVGGMVGGQLAGQPKQVGAVASQAPAMQRRMDSMQPDPAQDLMAADQALAQMPPDMQKQYRPVVQTAMQRAEASRGMA